MRLDDGTVVTTAEAGDGEVVLAVYPWDITVSTDPPDDSAMNVIGGADPQRSPSSGTASRVTIGP